MLENVRNLCIRKFLQDLFAQFLPQNGTRDTKELVTFTSITRMFSFYQMETL